MKNLKNIVLSTVMIASMSVFAQENQDNIDIVKTIKVEKAKFLEDGKMVDKKVSIIETRKQVVDTKPTQSHLLNQERLKTPIEVTKVIKIDSNNDANYDSAAVITYKILKDDILDLNVVMKGSAKSVEKDELILMGEKKEAYILGTEKTPVFGFINDENEFVVDFF